MTIFLLDYYFALIKNSILLSVIVGRVQKMFRGNEYYNTYKMKIRNVFKVSIQARPRPLHKYVARHIQKFKVKLCFRLHQKL